VVKINTNLSVKSHDFEGTDWSKKKQLFQNELKELFP